MGLYLLPFTRDHMGSSEGSGLGFGFAYYQCEPCLHCVPLRSFEWSLAVLNTTAVHVASIDTGCHRRFHSQQGHAVSTSSTALVSRFSISSRKNDISLRAFSNATIGSTASQRKQFGDQTIDKLFTSIFVFVTQSGSENTCAERS